MNNNIRSIIFLGICLLLCATILIAVVSCHKSPRNEATPAETIPDANQLYANAISALSANSICYRVVTTKETVIGNEVFTQSATQTVTFEAPGTAEMRGMVQETLSIGNHTVQIQEVFTDDTGYFSVDNGHFYAPMSPEEYMTRYAPAVLMEATLYSSITGFETDEHYTIKFTRASSLESWIWDKQAQFVSANGSSVITKEGQLCKSTYYASYQLGKAYVRLSVSTEAMDAEPVELPENLKQYQSISYIDAPRMLEIACGHLLESVSVTACYTDNILCQAFGDQKTQKIDIHTVNSTDWSSRIDTQLTLSNSSKTGTDTVITKSEMFTNGQYTIRINDSNPTANTEIDTQTMRSLCQDILVGTIMLPQHIVGAEMEEKEDSLVIRFTASEEFALMIRADACTALYQDPELLNAQTQSYETKIVTCYLTFDKATGLPLSSGFHYVGIYTIDALPYTLEYTADQQYELINDNAKQAIIAEPAP